MIDLIHQKLAEEFDHISDILPYFDHTFDGVIRKNIVDQFTSLHDISVSQLQQKLLPVAALYHITPISKFAVGAVVLGCSGDLYLGSNMEFTGTSLQFTIHAEQCALTNTAQKGEKGIQSIAINAAPCGFCRQFINELDGADKLEVIIPGKTTKNFSYYLPDSFSGRDLGIKTGILKRSLLKYKLEGDVDDELFQLALDAANQSYAPYSQYVSGISIKLSNGRIIQGSYFESAAYNPSVTPIQSAVIRARLNGESITEAEEVVFLQSENPFCNYKKVTMEILDTLAPNAIFSTGIITL